MRVILAEMKLEGGDVGRKWRWWSPKVVAAVDPSFLSLLSFFFSLLLPFSSSSPPSLIIYYCTTQGVLHYSYITIILRYLGTT